MRREQTTSGAGLIKVARLRAQLSQAQLAARAGVPTTMVSAYERGRRQATLPTLLRLVNAAGFDLRLHLQPLEEHDATLQAAEARRTPEQRRVADQRIELWRGAVEL
ncbi:MAG: helix-turn-helix transcriptional regulator [Candidatus Dormibacteraeota bacterium]|nr:helix-turn-helix transcriptional regulator [Candidatus Dormibacteraeota bacterium]